MSQIPSSRARYIVWAGQNLALLGSLFDDGQGTTIAYFDSVTNSIKSFKVKTNNNATVKVSLGAKTLAATQSTTANTDAIVPYNQSLQPGIYCLKVRNVGSGSTGLVKVGAETA
jgi:hypothetical protein